VRKVQRPVERERKEEGARERAKTHPSTLHDLREPRKIPRSLIQDLHRAL
jgi:hypothetical protein